MMPNGHWAEDFADHQYASVMVLESDETRLICISLDAIGMKEPFSTNVKNRISEKMGISVDHINVGYTHSHCAPQLSKAFGDIKGCTEEYLSFVSDKIMDALECALKKGLEEVEVFERNADASGFYSNRNGLDKIGDMALKVLEFRNAQQEVKGLVLSYACHSTVVNFQNTRSMNSDLSGYLARGLEKRTGIYPIVMIGAAGDMSNRCTRQGNAYDELIRVGEGLLSRLDESTEAQKLSVDSISVDTYQFKETYVTTKEQRQQQIANIHKQIEEAKTADLKRVFNSALSRAMLNPDGNTFEMDVKGSILRMGDMEICTMPAELFSVLGLQIKAAMPVKCPVFWGYSNYSVGYLYNIEEAGLSFESAATDIPAGVPEKIVEFLCKKVK
jgi:hypothetical protein